MTAPPESAPATKIPLALFCVAAAVANQDGTVQESNDLFRELTLNANDKSTNIWELTGLKTPQAVSKHTFQLDQGSTVPSKWVRIHTSQLHGTNNNWLLQMEDVDAGLRAKNQWSAILETTYDGFWDYHIRKDYEYMSPRFWEMFGYDASEKEHKPSEWMDMVHKDDFKASMVDLEAHFGSKGEVPYCRETRYKHKDGTWVWVLCRGKVIEWEEETGAPLRMIGTHTDITESKNKAKREQELMSANERFKAEQQLNEFVSHEVRNPLSAAISSVQFLEAELDNNRQQHISRESLEEDVHIISHSLDYIHQLLTSMLDINSFLEKGGVQLNPRPVLLKRDIAEPVYELYKHRANKLQFTVQNWWRDDEGILQLIPEEQDQRFNADVVRLKQILINIISNAIKFTKEGFVRVTVGRFDSEEPDKLSLICEDSGSGIPADKRSLLFQKYVQLNTQIQGSGVGLALTKMLVEAMNGSIVIDENYQSGLPGHPGTRFVVHIIAPVVGKFEAPKKKKVVVPAPAPPQQQSVHDDHLQQRSLPPPQPRYDVATTAQPVPMRDTRLDQSSSSLHETINAVRHQRGSNNGNGNGHKMTRNLRVLVVDDDQIIRKLLTRRLKNIDPTMVVETAESGEIAIQKIKESAEKYDLVLMDHFMPLCGGVLTGEETIRIIRPHIEGVIAGSSGNDMRKEHTQAGADLFWLKPVPKDDVLLDDLQIAFESKDPDGDGSLASIQADC